MIRPTSLGLRISVLCFMCGCLPRGDHDDGRGSAVDRQRTLLWGPGLKRSVVLPTRYFLIQAVDRSGENFTKSVGDKAFTVSMSDAVGQSVRIAINIFDRQDGSYIVRYRMYETVTDLKIVVLHNGKHVGKSPFFLRGQIYHEQCFCPVANIIKWQNAMDCPANYKQVKQDLSLFPSIDMEHVAREAVNRFSDVGRHSLCYYKIINNKIYRKTYGEHVGFKMFMDAMLLSITRKTVLPDVEFFLNLGDWPLERRKVTEKPLPIFSWCGSTDTQDIVMPTYDVTESTLEMMNRVTLDLISVQGNTGPAWENKTTKALWRGRDSRQERLDLVMMSRKEPDIIDAALTNMFFFPKDEEKYGKIVKHVSFFDFFKYKYQLNIDGTVAAYRLPYLLAGNSIVLKQDSPYYEHFYNQMKPYEHYIPFKRDLSDLKQKIQWAKDNDEEAKKIGEKAQQFIRNNMMPDNIFCYHVVLFQEYAKKLKRKPVVDDSFELVQQPSGQESQCKCQRKKVHALLTYREKFRKVVKSMMNFESRDKLAILEGTRYHKEFKVVDYR